MPQHIRMPLFRGNAVSSPQEISIVTSSPLGVFVPFFPPEFHTHLVASVLVYLAIVVNLYSNVSLCSHCILSDKTSCCCLKRHKKTVTLITKCVQVQTETHRTHPCVECEAHVIWWFFFFFSVRADILYHEFRLKKINIISALFHFSHLIIIIICPLLLLLLLIIAISVILLITLTFHTTLTIRYLQLWNPLHQCQSGQPHRWVQRCPLQEVRGSDRFSRGGRCAWGGAPEHYSMTLRHHSLPAPHMAVYS